MGNSIPSTVKELYYYMKGEFENIDTKFENMNMKLKLVFWIGGFAGTLFSGIVITIFKVVKWIK